jgi:23S rRNA (pseudouridine1915-N3)-methyltransferase
VGKKRSAGVQLLVEEYTNKLKNYCSLHDLPIRSNPRNARSVFALYSLQFAFFLYNFTSVGYALHFSIFFYMLLLCFSDEKAQVDDEDKAVMNLIRSDDWVYSFCLSVSNNIISTGNLNFHFLFRF